MTTTRRTLLAGSAAALPVLMLPRRAHAATKGTVVVLHTNDTHSRIDPFASGPYKDRAGVARRASLFARARADHAATLVVDAGDTFQGTPWFNEYKGEIDMRVMDALGYDATAIGNHEFDAGVDLLRQHLDRAPHMAALAANFTFTESCPLRDRVRPFVVVERGGLRIGLFGLGIAFTGLVNPRLHEGVDYRDPRAAAKECVALLRERACDVVIALSHLGYEGSQGEVGDVDWPKDVPGVDYVVGGHTHTFLDAPTIVSHASGWRTPVMQVGHSGLNVGRAAIEVDARGHARLLRSAPLAVRAA